MTTGLIENKDMSTDGSVNTEGSISKATYRGAVTSANRPRVLQPGENPERDKLVRRGAMAAVGAALATLGWNLFHQPAKPSKESVSKPDAGQAKIDVQFSGELPVIPATPAPGQPLPVGGYLPNLQKPAPETK